MEIPIDANVDVLPMQDNHAQAPESNLDVEKAKIWKSQAIILYVVSGKTFSLLGPYPNLSLD